MAKRKKEEIDTQTTFADMNVEGFRWYDPSKKNNNTEDNQKKRVDLTKKEKRAMIRGAYLAMLPFIGCVVLALCIIFLLAYLWLI